MKVKVLGRDVNGVVNFFRTSINYKGEGNSWFIFVKITWNNEYPINGLFQDLVAGNMYRDKAETVVKSLNLKVKEHGQKDLDLQPLIDEAMKIEI